jgi:hypothetical protein
MIRPLTLLSIIAAAGAGLHVYNTKHAVSLLDRELRTIAQEIREAEARTTALRADWTWATEQERLRALVQRHLALEPMQPSQFVRFAEAERRLPPPGAPDGPAAPFAPHETTAAENTRTRIALLPPEESPASRTASLTAASAPAAGAPPLSAPALAAVAQAALVAAAEPLPRPAPAAPEIIRSASRNAVFAPPPPPPVARPAEPRPAETRPPESRPAAMEVARATAAVPAPQPRPVAAPRPAAPVRLATEAPSALASAAPVSRPPQPVVARVAVAAVAPPRAPEAGATSLGTFGSALGGSSSGSVLGSARAALPPPVAFGSAGTALR